MLKILITEFNRTSKKILSSLQYIDDISVNVISNTHSCVEEKFNNNYFSFVEKNTDMSFFDLIVLSGADDVKFELAKHIVNCEFSGKIIVDKPFCSNFIEGNMLGKLLNQVDYIVPYTNRLNSNNLFMMKRDTINSISINRELKDKSIDPIPHILEIIIDIIGFRNKINFYFIDKHTINLKYGEYDFLIKFSLTKDSRTIKFNEYEILYPNYIARYYEKIEMLLQGHNFPTRNDYKKNKCMLFIVTLYEDSKRKYIREEQKIC